jgi:GTP 3',8-cyclase
MPDARSLQDKFGRRMRDLRISVTDRCNFRCLYCLPENEEAANFYRDSFDPKQAKPINYAWQPKSKFLTYEEMIRLTGLLAVGGINKIRITGGEPLMRRNLDRLIAGIAAIPGIEDIALTTNGFLFAKQAEALRAAGLNRITFSLDSLEPESFQKITGRDGLQLVCDAIQLAKQLDFKPIKVNAVLIRGINDHELETLAEFGREQSVSMRFIEFMPLDSSRGWQKEHVVSKGEMMERLNRRFDLVPVSGDNPAETAKRWRFADGPGEIGIIAPVSEAFCGHCNRIRLTADGNLRTCLFSLHEHDLKTPLREGATDAELSQRLREIVLTKEERHHIGEKGFVQPDRTMSYIGG